MAAGCVHDANIRPGVPVARVRADAGSCGGCISGVVKAGGGISAGDVFVSVDGISGDSAPSAIISLLGPAGTVLKKDTVAVGVWKTYTLGNRSISIRVGNIETSASGKTQATLDVSF